MELKLNKGQYETLMRLVYLGNWVVNGFHPDDSDAETDALEDTIYAQARNVGLGKQVLYDEELDGWYPAKETEDAWLTDLDDFKNDVFWEELEYQLADRDMVSRLGEERVDQMDPEEREKMARELADSYYEEFVKNGLKNFVLVRQN